MQDKIDTAETFLERVTAQDAMNSPSSAIASSDDANLNIIAWTLYAVIYEQKGLDLNAEITLRKAHKLNTHTSGHLKQHAESHLASLHGGIGEGIEEEQSIKKEEGITLKCSNF